MYMYRILEPLFFQELLETSKSDYVLFEASGLIKDALIREWNDIPANDIQGMRSYLLQYVINNPASSSFVRERIVQENLVTNLIFEFGEIENQESPKEKILRFLDLNFKENAKLKHQVF